MSIPSDALTTPAGTPSRVQALGALLGQETLQTSTWMRDGVIVRVRVSYWRPRAQLELGDLGLPQLAEHERASLRTLLRLGNKRLLPDAHYRELERRARDLPCIRNNVVHYALGAIRPAACVRRVGGRACHCGG